MEKEKSGGAPEICVMLSTVPPDRSEIIARNLLDKNLVACVNIQPVQSLYRWKGEFCNDAEHLLIIKTRRELADAVIQALNEVHPYEIPEILVLPVLAGHPPYLGWVYAETGAS